jgi:hypothetical protein
LDLAGFFRDHLWPGLATWVVLYIADYYLTIVGARLHRQGVHEKIVFEGSYELTPYFQKDIDSLRIISPRFIAAMVWLSLLLSAVWWLSRQLLWFNGAKMYLLALGMMILLQLTIHMRHWRNIFLFRSILRNSGVQGRIAYPKALTLRMSSFEVASFAILYFVLFLFTGSWFVLGGVLSCVALSVKNLRLARGYAHRAAPGEDATGRRDEEPPQPSQEPTKRA